MHKIEPWGIHWFRRDLRLEGNPGLQENSRQTHGRTLGLFCFDSKFLSRNDFSHNRFAFFLKTLEKLKEDFRKHHGDLLVIDCAPQDAFLKIIQFCQEKKLSLPALVTWNRDYEPFARKRDEKIESVLHDSGISTQSFRDHLIFEPNEILKGNEEDGFYQIYSPFGRKWFEKLATDEGKKRIQNQKQKVSCHLNFSWKKWHNRLPFDDALDEFIKKNDPHVTVPIPKAGFSEALSTLRRFHPALNHYKTNRDFPGQHGTSGLSVYLKNGSITTAQVITELDLDHLSWTSSHESAQFLKELVWREFYYHILFHRPDVEDGCFLKKYEHLSWENNRSLFHLWCKGMTGFPIVDAGMRQLLTTGWMHNRIRMVVASFLTKDLLIDWRWGARHFMKHLLDGDLAANSGGWQWAASTGCDPQPYFRIFNPWTQGKKFDPEGNYIRKYIPELKNAPTKALHDPATDRSTFGYPDPIVDHGRQREKALKAFQSV